MPRRQQQRSASSPASLPGPPRQPAPSPSAESSRQPAPASVPQGQRQRCNGYQYCLNGGAATALGGIACHHLRAHGQHGPLHLEVRATNATGNGAWSAVSNFTTAAPAGDTTAPTLSGVVLLGDHLERLHRHLTAGTDAVGVTGYERSVGGGRAVDPTSATCLPTATHRRNRAGATETVQVRAYDAAGNRPPRSAPASNWLPPSPALSPSPIRLQEQHRTVVASLSGIKAVVIRAKDMVAVLTKTGLTATASGPLSGHHDANLVAGTQYHVVIKPRMEGSGWRADRRSMSIRVDTASLDRRRPGGRGVGPWCWQRRPGHGRCRRLDPLFNGSGAARRCRQVRCHPGAVLRHAVQSMRMAP